MKINYCNVVLCLLSLCSPALINAVSDSSKGAVSNFAETSNVDSTADSKTAVRVNHYDDKENSNYNPVSGKNKRKEFETVTDTDDSEQTEQPAEKRQKQPEKTSQENSFLRCQQTLKNNSGKSKSNEDRLISGKFMMRNHEVSVSGVADGHGGSGVSEYVRQKLISYMERSLNQVEYPNDFDTFPEKYIETLKLYILAAFGEIDKVICQKGHALLTGAAVSLTIRIKDIVFLVNLGDSRTMVFENNQLIFTTKDHKPDDIEEKARIERFGGTVEFLGVWRTNKYLAMSRALGDCLIKVKSKEHFEKMSKTCEFYYPDGILSAFPDIKTIKLDSAKKYLFFSATDGVFDVINSDGSFTEFFQKFSVHELAPRMCDAIVLRSQQLGSRDDISASISMANY